MGRVIEEIREPSLITIIDYSIMPELQPLPTRTILGEILEGPPSATQVNNQYGTR